MDILVTIEDSDQLWNTRLVRSTHVPNKRTHPKRIINERHCSRGLSLPNQRGDEAQHLKTPELALFSHTSRRTQSDDSQDKRSHEKGIGEEVHEVPE